MELLQWDRLPRSFVLLILLLLRVPHFWGARTCCPPEAPLPRYLYHLSSHLAWSDYHQNNLWVACRYLLRYNLHLRPARHPPAPNRPLAPQLHMLFSSLLPCPPLLLAPLLLSSSSPLLGMLSPRLPLPKKLLLPCFLLHSNRYITSPRVLGVSKPCLVIDTKAWRDKNHAWKATF